MADCDLTTGARISFDDDQICQAFRRLLAQCPDAEVCPCYQHEEHSALAAASA